MCKHGYNHYFYYYCVAGYEWHFTHCTLLVMCILRQKEKVCWEEVGYILRLSLLTSRFLDGDFDLFPVVSLTL